MSFSSIPLLEQFRDHGRFPGIHDAMFNAVATHAKGRSLCDLGCCHGLMAQRLSMLPGFKVVGIEGNKRYVAEGRSHGITAEILNLKVNQAAFGLVSNFLEKRKVDVIVARRVMPELWGEDIPGGKLFSKLLAGCGVKEIFLEGRIFSERATNALSTMSAEVELFIEEFQFSRLNNGIGYLSKR
jgi:hypothetical protein